MPKINILCPYHGVTEELELPESYVGFEGIQFDGDVPCGYPKGPDHRAILHIEIIQSKVRRIGLCQEPSVRRTIRSEKDETKIGRSRTLAEIYEDLFGSK